VDEFPSRERITSVALEPRVSAVVVVRHMKLAGRAPLELCLRSVIAEPMIEDVVIVDHVNAPEISSALRALQADRRDVKVIAAPPNASSGAAANLGAQHARGRWLLFIDPNVVVQRGAIDRMAAAGDEAQSPCIVGGRLTDLEGRERRAARVGALNSFSAIAVAMDLPAIVPKRTRNHAPSRFSAVSGAFMAIPRRDFEALNGFDEAFKTDCADLDLCRRATAAGGAVLFHPAAAGVQFAHIADGGRKRAQGLARFAARSARTRPEKLFAAVAEPALATLLALKRLIAGRPPPPR